MYLLILALAAWFLFQWRALKNRLDSTDRELQALKRRLGALEPPAPAATPAAATPPAAPPATEPPRVPVPPAPTAAPRTAHTAESLETMIGSRWLLYVGIVAVVIGVSYFIKLAFDNHWINETTRVLIGGVAGVMLAYAGMRFVRAGYFVYGQIISGGGVAILYLSVYAAFTFYALVSQPSAFALMCVVTALAAWLADGQRSQALALIAIGGGFATPFLLSTGRDAEVALFAYDAFLVAGTILMARRREWPWLNMVGYYGVVVTIISWGATFYTPDKFLTTEAFLTLFCGMFLYLLYEGRAAVQPVTRQVRNILWSAPALYHVGSLVVLYAHAIALLVYLTLMHVVGVAAARHRQASWIRLVSWIAVICPLAFWVAHHATPAWFIPGLAVVAGIYGITLLAHLDLIVRTDGHLDDIDIGLVHASGLAAYGCAYILMDAIHPFAAAPAAAAFAVWQLGLAGFVARRDRRDALHFVGVAFTLTSLAIAIQFHGAGAIAGWAAEGAVAVWLGLRERRVWLRAGGAFLLAVSAAALIALQFDPPYAGQIVFINIRALAGAFVITLLYGVAALYHRAPVGGGSRVQPRDVLLVAANVLTLVVLTGEISAFWRLREPYLNSRDLVRNARLSRQAMMSVTWAAYATGLIVTGLRRRYAPVRYLAMVVFGGTILKVFMVDLASLDRIYRVASIISLGALLLASSYLYQRERARS